MSEEEKKNTAVAETGSFAPVSADDLSDLMNEDLNGLEFSPDRIKIPAGGATTFEIPDGDSEDGTRSAKEITGVILLHHPAFAYYATKYTGGSNPPDCGSFDGVHGVGAPGGDCRTCPYNQFGSGEGKSKACKNRRMLYILPEGEIFPMTLSLPTGSLKAFTTYVKHQLTKGRKLSKIVTRITLKKAVNASGITFSQTAFSFVRALSPQEVEAVSAMSGQAREYAAGLTLSALAEDEPVVDAETGEVIEPLN
jgi:hypothetical protein